MAMLQDAQCNINRIIRPQGAQMLRPLYGTSLRNNVVVAFILWPKGA